MKIFATSLGALSGLALLTCANSGEPDLRQVECRQLIIYTPATGASDETLCDGFGGLSRGEGNVTRPSLTILVKNLPVGGDAGLTSADWRKKN